MNAKPLLVTMADDDNEDEVTLLVRYSDDQDYFVWGKITTAQRSALADCGVFELQDGDQA